MNEWHKAIRGEIDSGLKLVASRLWGYRLLTPAIAWYDPERDMWINQFGLPVFGVEYWQDIHLPDEGMEGAEDA